MAKLYFYNGCKTKTDNLGLKYLSNGNINEQTLQCSPTGAFVPQSVNDQTIKQTSIKQSNNQTVNQSNNQIITKSNNQTIKQSNNQTIKQSNNQTIKQSNNQTIKQSNNQTFKQ